MKGDALSFRYYTPYTFPAEPFISEIIKDRISTRGTVFVFEKQRIADREIILLRVVVPK